MRIEQFLTKVNVQIPLNEKIALYGKNGAGKVPSFNKLKPVNQPLLFPKSG